MSHDRGCSCGKEKWDYHLCTDRECSRSPLYDAAYHQQQVEKRLGRHAPSPTAQALESYKPSVVPIVVRKANVNDPQIAIYQKGTGNGTKWVRGPVQISGPCEVRATRQGLQVFVNPGVTITWTRPGRKAKKAA